MPENEEKTTEVTSGAAAEATEKKGFHLSPLPSKIINIVVDVIVAAVLILAVILAVCSIRSKKLGYENCTVVFGHAYLAVASESMDADIPEEYAGKLGGNIKKGDLIKIKILDDDEKRKLEVGDIITFAVDLDGDGYKDELNSHRIVELIGNEGSASGYYTKGDNNASRDSGWVQYDDVIGVFEKKSSGIGHVFLFMNSSTGFFVCIVLPTLLIVVFCAVNLVIAIMNEKKKEKAEAEVAAVAEKDALKEQMRRELLAEMQAQNGGGSGGEASTQKEDKTDGGEAETDDKGE